MLIQLQLSTVNQISSSRRKSTIQISSSSPPYPTPPPSAPSSPTSSEQSTSSSIPTPQLPKKVRVPLLSPGGLYGTPSGSSGPQSVPSQMPPTSSRQQTVTPTATPTLQPDAFCRPLRDGETGEPPAKKPKLDTKALAEASKNLTQTLKQLSSEVLTTKPEASTPKPKKEVKIIQKELGQQFLHWLLDWTIRLTNNRTFRSDRESEEQQTAKAQSLSPCTTMGRVSTLALFQELLTQLFKMQTVSLRGI